MPKLSKSSRNVLNRVPNRGYSTDFMKGQVGAGDYAVAATVSSGEAIFVGNVLNEVVDGRGVVEVRNTMTAGQQLELLTPDGKLSAITLAQPLVTRDGRQVEVVNNTDFLMLADSPALYSILRRIAKFQLMKSGIRPEKVRPRPARTVLGTWPQTSDHHYWRCTSRSVGLLP